MDSLKNIKNRMKTIDSIIKATNAMKMVSTVKLAKINNKKSFAKESAELLAKMLQKCAKEAIFDQSLAQNFWLRRTSGKALLIVLGTDQGFCGSFNQSIIECYKNTIKENSGAFVETFGKKCSHIPLNIANLKAKRTTKDKFNIHDFSRTLSNLVYEYIVNHNVCKVLVISGEFRNVLVQKGKCSQIFPIESNETDNKYTEVEGDKQRFIEDVFYAYLTKMFTAIITEHIVSELSARTMAMDNSVKNAKDMFEKLSVLYNRIRQAKITQELTEIVSSIECVQ